MKNLRSNAYSSFCGCNHLLIDLFSFLFGFHTLSPFAFAPELCRTAFNLPHPTLLVNSSLWKFRKNGPHSCSLSLALSLSVSVSVFLTEHIQFRERHFSRFRYLAHTLFVLEWYFVSFSPSKTILEVWVIWNNKSNISILLIVYSLHMDVD